MTSEATKEKLRFASIAAGCNPPHKKGDSHYNWKGGITPSVMKVRNSQDYKEWRRTVFERDNYICQSCGQRGGTLQAHHDLPFAQFPELRLEVLNGMTLCKKCHLKKPKNVDYLIDTGALPKRGKISTDEQALA